ncbi:MAG: [Fe-Fe] hydrogenase large subunit C-terminal domain-containing protein, partial [Traorella sp.]
MKSLITLVEYNCKSCLKCVRSCPTKSIRFEKNHPYIIEEECIHCGNCYLCCPQSAKQIQSDLDKVKGWLNQNEKVVLSIAPSYQVVWKNYAKLKADLLNLGFYAVEETAQGAKVVSGQYGVLLQEKQMENIIETCCPTIVEMIEKEYPQLVKYLSPVASPMIVHGRMLKQKYPDAKVVFLSPCISKQYEAKDSRYHGSIDAVLSMPDLDNWLTSSNDTKQNDVEDENIARIYPISGGIIQTIESMNGYKSLAVEGINRCRALLNSIANGHLKGYFFELNACEGGCLGGPYLLAYKDNEWLAQSRISEHNRSRKIQSQSNELTMACFEDHSVSKKIYSEQEIDDVLNGMGKYDRSKRLDCGACGYNTCREKAIAVLDGKSDPKHCLPYALENAQSLSNLIIKHSPNGIIVLDCNAHIKEINQSALRLLGMQNYSVKGFHIQALIHSDALMETLNKNVQDVTYYVEEVHDG